MRRPGKQRKIQEQIELYNHHLRECLDAFKQSISEYCNDMATSEKCARKIVRKSTGKPPADNFSPTGELLD